MKIGRIIVLLTVLFVVSGTVWGKNNAKTKHPAAITEQEQMRLDYYLYAALDAAERKNHAEAFFLLELCQSIDSLNPTVSSLRGSYMQSLYGAKAALPLLRRAYEGSPDDYWYRYAVAAYENGQRSVALKVIADMEKRQPKDLDVLELHEQILRHEHKYKQALAIRDKVDKLTGEPSVYSVITRFEILNESGEKEKALQVLDNYLEQNPNDARMRAMRTDLRLQDARMKNDRHAGDSLLNEQLHSAEVALPSKLAKLNNNSEWLGYDAGKKKNALLELRDQYPYEQQAYQALLDHELEQGNKSAALEIGRTMLTMNPTDNKLREQIADLMRDDENITNEQVGLFIDESYSVLPDDPKWGYFKAMRCWQREDYDSTLIVLERALQHAEEPTVRLTILVLYGDILGHVKNYEKAFATYDEVLNLAPDHISTLNNYAWTLAISGGDLKKAEKMSQRTIQKEGNNPTYLDTYAWILHLQGQDQLALFYIKKALEYATSDDGTIAEHYEEILHATQKE